MSQRILFSSERIDQPTSWKLSQQESLWRLARSSGLAVGPLPHRDVTPSPQPGHRTVRNGSTPAPHI